ncbi:hypothetical protein Q8A67_018026 [Cirrhinus molitorella]|uniref:Uncharacterized protein n=1 Tax=Cirrhinus molitorella TaxID=172907 RepID=A0AA88PMU2_9TELE|nr:hypothetical protein Q8A67_018026 [Cirrhinus molitorella]
MCFCVATAKLKATAQLYSFFNKLSRAPVQHREPWQHAKDWKDCIRTVPPIDAYHKIRRTFQPLTSSLAPLTPLYPPAADGQKDAAISFKSAVGSRPMGARIDTANGKFTEGHSDRNDEGVREASILTHLERNRRGLSGGKASIWKSDSPIRSALITYEHLVNQKKCQD